MEKGSIGLGICEHIWHWIATNWIRYCPLCDKVEYLESKSDGRE